MPNTQAIITYDQYNYTYDYQQDIVDEVSTLVSYLNNICDSNGLNTEFFHWDAGELEIDPSVIDTEEKFAKKLVDEMKSEHTVVNDDIIIAPHDKGASWGYGKHEWAKGTGSNDGGDEPGMHVCMQYADDWMVPWEARGFMWHEVGHAMWAGHPDGDYQIDWEEDYYGNYHRVSHEITPMCMSYLHNGGGDPDTKHDAEASAPDNGFCEGKPDGEMGFKHGQQTHQERKMNHDITRYGHCALSKIKNWIEDKEK